LGIFQGNQQPNEKNAANTTMSAGIKYFVKLGKQNYYSKF
jgi:hypothetical protein